MIQGNRFHSSKCTNSIKKLTENCLIHTLGYCFIYRPIRQREKYSATGFFNRGRGNFRNLNNFLFYDKAEAFNNEIRHERKTNKDQQRFGKQKFASKPNFGSEYYDSHSGKPVYKYYKKFPNYGYGRKRRSARYRFMIISLFSCR